MTYDIYDDIIAIKKNVIFHMLNRQDPEGMMLSNDEHIFRWVETPQPDVLTGTNQLQIVFFLAGYLRLAMKQSKLTQDLRLVH